ncbi:hypothetical protein Cgig2_006849 [Carnegiea gigantea]|uniref:glucan endo-1,3-beta-D-glucosidase n=1 Tax=Carnegiea gigantea TaxID=171969 RepID=A0A9Q1Q7T1_9CARY|nr:hypothetical protein Cgig2_006849 [Carnegiea gigantea]
MASLLLFFSLLLLTPLSSSSSSGQIGINYGRIANNLPPPEKVVQLLKTQNLTRIKLYDSDPNILSAFSGSPIFSLTVALPNENLSSAASSPSYTDSWVRTRIRPFADVIYAIAVGNEVNSDPKLTRFLVLAMNNLFSSLQKFSLASSIKISSPLSLSSLQNSYPPSSGSFKPDLVQPMIKPMLDFLRKTSSYLMVNAYPFFAYSANSGSISLDYALFRPNSVVVDANNGLKYTNLFEAQLDAVHSALGRLNYNDIDVVVSETGWPSKGDANEVGASEPNAAAYNGNLVRRILTGGGTPLRPNDPIDAYLFALFNENQKPGPTSERNYGLFYPNEKKVYDIPLTAEEVAAEGGEAVAPAAAAPTWCVANEAAAKEKLQEALDYACGEGGADCRPIQPGATCYDPDSLVAHASYAFNSYYQMKARASGTCYFGGVAHVVIQPPSKFF